MDRKNIEDIFTLTPVQEGMLFHYIKEQDSPGELYLEQLRLVISGELKAPLFEQAWQCLVTGNPMLRTVFRWHEIKTPHQLVLKQHTPEMYFLEPPGNTPDTMEWLAEVEQQDRQRSFNLENVPFRITLCQLENMRWAAIITYHHILFDGWSIGVLLREFLTIYQELLSGQQPSIPAKTRFKEYVQWLRVRDKAAQATFWRHYLEGFDTRTGLPVVPLERPPEPGTGRCRVNFEDGLNERLEEFARERKVTPSALLYTGWGLLLQKYNNSKDVMYGTTISGRSARLKGIEDMVGLFINTIPLRVTTRSGQSLIALAADVHHSLQQREDHEATSLVDIKTYSSMEGSRELFDSIVAIDNYPLDAVLTESGGSINLESYYMFEISNYDLTVCVDIFDHISVFFIYNRALFEESHIRRLAAHYSALVEALMAKPDTLVGHLEIVGEEEKYHLVYELNRSSKPSRYPFEKTIHYLVEEQVERTPGATAMVFGQRSIDYQTVNARANQLARYLRNKGVGHETVVALIGEFSFEMAIGMLAILKSGGSYCPLIPTYPLDRVQYILQDSGAGLMLSQIDFKEQYPDAVFNGDIVDIRLVNESVYNGETENLIDITEGSGLAFVLYTSGSTGKPKGVMVEHRHVNNLLWWFVQVYHLKPGDSVLQLTDYTFDPHLEDIFATWQFGGVLHVITRQQLNEVEPLRDYIRKNNVNVVNCVPAYLKELLAGKEKLDSLKVVISGGDRLSDPLKDQLLDDGYALYNHYGLIETTVDVLISKCAYDQPASVGWAMANNTVYILDDDWNLMPQGTAGEITISGDSVVRGYMNNPELTHERYRNDPFIPGKRMIRTRDLGRMRPDGTAEILDRMDNQIKIRGFRIEPGEIESRLVGHPDIREAVVLAVKDSDGEPHLCAYIIPLDTLETLPDTGSIRTWLSKHLPDYMVPQLMVFIEKVPLTPLGKVNRKALPSPFDVMLEHSHFTAPTTRTEKQLAAIWAEVLGIDIEKISVHDDFFDIGGHSLKATVLLNRIRKSFNVQIPLRTIFSQPTIKAFAASIERAGTGGQDAILPVERREYYPQSSAQKRMFIVNRMKDKTDISDNAVEMILIEGKLDPADLERTFRGLMERHEALRTSFHLLESQPIQHIHDARDIDFTFRRIEASEDGLDEVIDDFIKPFDLSAAPLMRLGLIRLEPEKHLLLFDMHHILTDGITTGILADEFVRLYYKEELPPLTIQYSDYTMWHNRYLLSSEVKKQEEFWLSVYAEKPPQLNLSTDFPRPLIQNFEGDFITFQFDPELTAAVNRLVSQSESTVYIVLLAIYGILLAKYGGQDDLAVGTPVAGRQHADLEKIMGLFVNTLAMRLRPWRDIPFCNYLDNVKQHVLSAFENQDYPFEDLVSRLEIPRDAARAPLFDTMFVVQNADVNPDKHDDDPYNFMRDLRFSPYPYKERITQFDIITHVFERSDRITFKLRYCVKLFKKETIQRFSRHLVQIAEEVTDQPDLLLADIRMFSDEEQAGLIDTSGSEHLKQMEESIDFDF